MDRDALRFHWFKDLQTKTIEVLRFTRTLFGLAASPFLLGTQRRESCRSRKQRRIVDQKDLWWSGPTWLSDWATASQHYNECFTRKSSRREDHEGDIQV